LTYNIFFRNLLRLKESSKNIKNKKNWKMEKKEYIEIIKNTDIPQLHKDLIVGTLLGDASITVSKSKNLASMKFEQGDKHKDYLFWLFNHMKEYSTFDSPKEVKRFDSRYNKTNVSYYFNINSLSLLYPYAKLFLSVQENLLEDKLQNIKIIPDAIDTLLTPAAISFWISDDGYSYINQRGGLTLCTDSFKNEEVLRLKDVLEIKFKLKCTIHTKLNKNKNKYFRIYVSKSSMPLLR